jgi:hypothetical protein
LRAALQIGASRKGFVSVGEAYAQNTIFSIEYRTAVSLAPPKKRIHFLSDWRAALQIGASRKSVIAVGRAYARNIKFCIEGRVAASLAPKKPYRLHRFLWPQDRRINLDPTPLNEVCGFRIEGSTTYTTQRVLWPQDRKIHLDPTPLTGFCGLRIEGSTWIRHPPQGSTASRSQ